MSERNETLDQLMRHMVWANADLFGRLAALPDAALGHTAPGSEWSVGAIAHLAGAIDSDNADKAARFMQLCDAFDIPVVTLVDTPGMMVGPAIEATALVRHCTRLFVVGANITVPMVSVVLRKSYGLGAQAMMGGSADVVSGAYEHTINMQARGQPIVAVVLQKMRREPGHAAA